MQSQFDIATATGVDVHLNIAGAGARSYAFVIDWHIRLLFALAWFAVTSMIVVGSLNTPDGSGENGELYFAVVVAPAIAIYALYHLVLEILMRGRTPGKRIAGVRIVSIEGQEPTLMALVIRNVLRLIDSLPFGYTIGLLFAFFTTNSVRIGDLAAGTLLIYESDSRGEKLNTVPVSPAAISAYGLDRAELAQDLLNRWSSLGKEEKVDLAIRLIPQMDRSFTVERDAELLHAKLKQLLETPH
ncbi:MAG: RDD family protein [Halioglobus sp.]